ncbi:ABC transporter ATP-binding protein [Croceicoccus mobilis]|uniref:ABC transporter ATP-binding protein n=2 Tax=Croceicoccus mobilis TaxID=1703339 RepID=A0A917DVU7_9SPHN|nr:ABC transporter ATP-binding protein [Croceicoccus mobilis]
MTEHARADNEGSGADPGDLERVSDSETETGRKDAGKEEASGSKTRSIGPLFMLLGAARKYPGRLVGAGCALVTTAAATLAIPNFFKLVIDRGFDGGDINRWFEYLLLLVVVLAIGTAFRFYLVSWLAERVVADLRVKVYDNLVTLPPSFFEENNPREISSRMTADTAIIEQVVGSTISVALRNLLTVIGGTIYLFILAPMLTVWLLVAIPIVIIPIVLMGRRVRNLSRSSQDRIADIGAMVSEVLGGIRIVQVFNQQGREAGRFGEAVERSFATAKSRIWFRAILTALAMALVLGALVGLMWRGALDVEAGHITGGTIAAFVITAGLVGGAFGALAEVYGNLLRASGAAQRLGELLATTPAIAAPARPQELPTPARGSIAFQNVTFRYPTRPEDKALNDFSLVIEPGETVAIVGPSGAGKSTLFQLIARFYDPQVGSVRVDGIDLTRADPIAVRDRLALVPQESTLFNASARDNLRYGAWEADDDAIWKAARAANAEQFLKALPNGLDTVIGDAGARLSGGQRQRVAIARALLRDAPILLLDEATSALDAQSEQLVQSALETLMKGRTTIVIAHRLATVRAADRIVVMEDGRIVEQGTHAELSANSGLYASLAALQFE